MSVITHNSIIQGIISPLQDGINYVGILGRSLTLGILPLSNIQVSSPLPQIAGGLRLIKAVALPLYLDRVYGHVIKIKKYFDGGEVKGRSRELDVDSFLIIGQTGNAVESVGLIGLGLNAVGILTVNVLVQASNSISFAGIVLQIAFIYADIKKIIQAEQHKYKLDEGNIDDILDDKSRKIKDLYGIKRERLNDLKDNTDYLKKRLTYGQFCRALSVLINLVFLTATILLLFFPPLAILGWSLVLIGGVSLIGLSVYRLVREHQLCRELAA